MGLLLLAHAPMPEARRVVINSLYSLRWISDMRIRKTCSSFVGNVVFRTAWLRLQLIQTSYCNQLAMNNSLVGNGPLVMWYQQRPAHYTAEYPQCSITQCEICEAAWSHLTSVTSTFLASKMTLHSWQWYLQVPSYLGNDCLSTWFQHADI